MKRDRTEISADILRVAKDGALKTHIVYKANLNFSIVKRYLSRLIGTGLLEKIDDHYFTTPQGREFIYHADTLIRSM